MFNYCEVVVHCEVYDVPVDVVDLGSSQLLIDLGLDFQWDLGYLL
jgi:hypothetical protein